MDIAKFNAWSRNKGLSVEDAQKTYILTYASLSSENEESCLKVLLGEEEAQQTSLKIQNTVSVPVVNQAEKDAYISNLTEDNAKIFEIFAEIREGSEELLLEKLESGEISANTVNQEGMSLLMLAVDESYSTDWLQTLLNKGANIYHQDNSGNTALHYASMVDNLEIVTFLIEHEADKCKSKIAIESDLISIITIKNNDGELPIDLWEDDEVKEAIGRVKA